MLTSSPNLKMGSRWRKPNPNGTTVFELSTWFQDKLGVWHEDCPPRFFLTMREAKAWGEYHERSEVRSIKVDDQELMEILTR